MPDRRCDAPHPGQRHRRGEPQGGFDQGESDPAPNRQPEDTPRFGLESLGGAESLEVSALDLRGQIRFDTPFRALYSRRTKHPLPEMPDMKKSLSLLLAGFTLAAVAFAGPPVGAQASSGSNGPDRFHCNSEIASECPPPATCRGLLPHHPLLFAKCVIFRAQLPEH